MYQPLQLVDLRFQGAPAAHVARLRLVHEPLQLVHDDDIIVAGIRIGDGFRNVGG